MLPITKMPIKYNYSNLAGRTISYIVVHDTGNTAKGSGVDGHFAYFNGADRQSSACFFVDDHKIGQFNPDLKNCYTWHCGDGRGVYGITNRNSIGVEICVNSDGNYEQAVQNAVELVKYLMEAFNIDIDHVVTHYMASRKNCPASMSANNWARWIEFKNKLVEVKKVKNLVVYNNYIDKRGAERLAEHLQCPVMDASQITSFDYSCVENVIGVGGGTFNPAVKIVVKGTDRDDTTISVLKYIGKLQ